MCGQKPPNACVEGMWNPLTAQEDGCNAAKRQALGFPRPSPRLCLLEIEGRRGCTHCRPCLTTSIFAHLPLTHIQHRFAKYTLSGWLFPVSSVYVRHHLSIGYRCLQMASYLGEHLFHRSHPLPPAVGPGDTSLYLFLGVLGLSWFHYLNKWRLSHRKVPPTSVFEFSFCSAGLGVRAVGQGPGFCGLQWLVRHCQAQYPGQLYFIVPCGPGMRITWQRHGTRSTLYMISSPSMLEDLGSSRTTSGLWVADQFGRPVPCKFLWACNITQ